MSRKQPPHDLASTGKPVLRQRDAVRETLTDTLAVEEPLEIRLWYTDARQGRIHKTLSITMRTPGQDEMLALGFLFTEGIISHRDQVEGVEQVNDNVVKVVLREAVSLDLSRLERHFYTTSSCGICGKASLEALSTHGAEVIRDNRFRITEQTLMALPDALRAQQSLFSLTGGNHGVGLFNHEGDVLLCYEDVGRHNAMDKLIGQCFMESTLPLQNMGIIVSGRASFELMQKALMAGALMLVAVGAPSSLAVELAEEFNMTLAGFVSHRGFNIYHGAQTLLPNDQNNQGTGS